MGESPQKARKSMLRPPARGLVDFSLGGWPPAPRTRALREWPAAPVEPGGRSHTAKVAANPRLVHALRPARALGAWAALSRQRLVGASPKQSRAGAPRGTLQSSAEVNSTDAVAPRQESFIVHGQPGVGSSRRPSNQSGEPGSSTIPCSVRMRPNRSVTRICASSTPR